MRRRTLLLAVGSIAFTGPVAAQQESLWSALKEGGVALLLRHAQTERGVGDPPGFRLGDCSTQRNLSEEGRTQARRVGAELAGRKVNVGQVLSSQWCRCLDTARLAFPGVAVEPWPALNSFFDDRSTEARQTREVAARISAVRPPTNAVFVTHHVNILALTGEAVGAGEAILLRPAAARPQVLGRLAL